MGSWPGKWKWGLDLVPLCEWRCSFWGTRGPEWHADSASSASVVWALKWWPSTAHATSGRLQGTPSSPGTHEIQLFPSQQNPQLLQTPLGACWVGAANSSEPKHETPQFKSQSCFPEGKIGMNLVAKGVWGLHRPLSVTHLQSKQLSDCHETRCPGWRPLASQKVSYSVMLDVHVTAALPMVRTGHYGILFFF